MQSPSNCQTPSFMLQDIIHALNFSFRGSSKINGAKFSDTCSVRANWLCMGWPFCLAEMRREFQTEGKLFCTTLYRAFNPLSSLCRLYHVGLWERPGRAAMHNHEPISPNRIQSSHAGPALASPISIDHFMFYVDRRRRRRDGKGPFDLTL